jgi:hypothetical protein
VIHDAYCGTAIADPRDVIAQDDAVVPSGAYDFFGTPLAIATMLRHDPKMSSRTI